MADKESESEKSSGGLLPIINIALLVLVLGIAGFNTWKIMNIETSPTDKTATSTKKDLPIPEAEDTTDSQPILIELDDFTVNLSDTTERRFLRTKIKLEVRSEESQKKVESNLAKISDLIITLLSSKKFSERRTAQGKFSLKEELVHRINRLVGGKPVKKLYFTDFVSQ